MLHMTEPAELGAAARPVVTKASILVAAVALIITGLWLALTPEGLLGKADAVGYAVCHRIDLRSFHLGERTLPLCARCTGMYLAALTTLIFISLTVGRAGHYPRRSITAVLVIGAVIWAIDGLNSFATLLPALPSIYQPSNTLRLITGSAIGTGLMTMIYAPFQQLAWRRWEPRQTIPDWAHFGALLLTVGLVDLLVLSEQPLVLYPLAILSAAGVLTLLTCAYSLIALQVLRREAAARGWIDLLVPVGAGFCLALMQVAGLDWIRYMFTGTWSGFHL